jgi:ribosomal protein L19E
MNINEAIDLLKSELKRSPDKKDQQLLQWLLELRTLRAQLKTLDDENEHLRGEYERLLLESKSGL